MQINIDFPILALAALIPLFMGFIYYNPKVLGGPWMKAIGKTEEEMRAKKVNLVGVLIVCYIFAFMMAMAIQFMVIHQFSVLSVLATDASTMEPGSKNATWLAQFMTEYGTNFRTFKHGAFHGFIGALTLAMPIVGTAALFEQRPFKYTLITAGYWAISMALMGGVICQFAGPAMVPGVAH